MKKFTRILQVLMIVMLSVSVVFAQDYSKKISNAKTQQEAQYYLDLKKQSPTPTTGNSAALKMNSGNQSANFSAIQDVEKKATPQKKESAVSTGYYHLGNINPLQIQYAPKAEPFIYDPKDYPAPTDQGGDVIATATVIPAIPYAITGTTVGYVDDYDEVCPYGPHTSPDVVYSYTPAADVTVDISLCNDLTDYDTKLFVYENAATPGAPYACNDDACATIAYPYSYVSELLGVFLTGGNTYYIVVDGYGGASGIYDLTVAEYVIPPDCVWGVDIFCPPGASDEGELCGDDTNGGCNTDPVTPPFTTVASAGETFCGTTWASGSTRDTDWYEMTLLETSTVTMTADADALIIYGGIADANGNMTDLVCADASQILPNNTAGPCNETSVVIGDLPPGTYWFFIGMTVYEGFPCDNNYWVTWTVEEVECAAPSPTFTSDRGLTGAYANWTELNGATQAEVCWGLTGTIDPDVPATYVGSAFVDQSFGGPEFSEEITGLTAATAYTWYVRSICPDLDAPGDWSVANNFMTYCVECPPGSTLEGEGVIADDTFDVTNGGCNATPNVFSQVACAETVCGSSGFYFSGALNYRDTDWYELEIPAGVNKTVTVEFMANYSIQGLILAPPCGATTTLASYVAAACELGVMTAANLAPGTYYVWMGADFTGGDADWSEYYFTVSCDDVVPGTGCENTSSWGSATVDPAGALTTISTCNYAGEYSPVSGIVLGDTYEFTFEDLGTGGYVTLTDGLPTGANILAYGPSPLQWVATYSGDVYAHWSLDEYCTTDASCHSTWVQCLTCVSYDLDGTINYFGDTFPMDYISVTLDDGSDAIIATTSTNGAGFYQFTGLAPGTYTLGASTSKPRGGEGPTDFNLIVSHILGTPLTGLQFLAADVDNSGTIGPTDYNLVVSAILGDIQFANPDWIFGEVLEVIIPSAKQTYDFHAICSGDPDGSYNVPPAGPQEVCQTAEFIDISTLPASATGDTDGGLIWSSYEACDLVTITAPGKWFTFTGDGTELLVDLCTNTTFDTKLHIYSGSCEVPVCVGGNDDFCGLQSGLSFVSTAGEDYFVLVHGYSANTGPFELTISEVLPCVVDCPPGATMENEPEIMDDEEDVTNGGCNSVPELFGDIACGETICGKSNTFLYTGANYRDTDWYLLDLGAGGIQDITVEAEAEFPLIVFIVTGPCAAPTYVYEQANACEVLTVSAAGLDPNLEYYIMVTSSVFVDVPYSDYWVSVTCTPAVAPSGCINTSLYPSTAVTVDPTGALTSIETCNYASEYSIITGITALKTYEFIISDLGTGAYVTIADEFGTILDFGDSPFQYTAPDASDIYVHWTLSEYCATDAACHVTSVQCIDCP